MDAAVDALEAELGICSEELRGRVAEAEMQGVELDILRGRIEQCEGEADGLRSELGRARLRTERELRGLAAIARELDEARDSARGQATKIRLRALREAADLSARLSYSTGEVGESQRVRLFEALEGALDRVAGDWDSELPAPPLSREVEAPPPFAGRPQRRSVSVDVGPFADFSQLVRFEDAANAIGATGDISIKRFSEGRARIDVALSEPVDLLRELEERCDLEFEVRSTSEDEIVLDVEAS